MNIPLSETSPAEFARRALLPVPRKVSALVTDTPMLEVAARELRAAVLQMNKSVVEAPLDGQFQQRRAAVDRTHVDAVIVASTSEDAALWRWVDLHRSRIQDDATTLFLLSRNAAESMSSNAPHLVSLLGPLRYYRPSPLQALIDSAANARYPDLYDTVDQRPAKDLERVTDEILSAFGDPRVDDRAWRRFGHMGHALLLEVLPTIAGHWPEGTAIADAVLAALDQWLAPGSAPASISDHIDGPLVPQAIAEAVDVVRNAARLTEAAGAHDAMAEMVDDCLQGYAIFPGSAGRRSLFDWWLHCVVPEAWELRRPTRFPPASRPQRT